MAKGFARVCALSKVAKMSEPMTRLNWTAAERIRLGRVLAAGARQKRFYRASLQACVKATAIGGLAFRV